MTRRERQVDHRQDGIEALGELRRGRGPVGNPGLHDLLLGSRDPSRGRGFGNEEGSGDLGCRQAGDEPERECDPSRQGKGWVSADEDQSQAVVLDAVVDCVIG